MPGLFDVQFLLPNVLFWPTCFLFHCQNLCERNHDRLLGPPLAWRPHIMGEQPLFQVNCETRLLFCLILTRHSFEQEMRYRKGLDESSPTLFLERAVQSCSWRVTLLYKMFSLQPQFISTLSSQLIMRIRYAGSGLE